MKTSIRVLFPGMAALFLFQGCAPDDPDYVPGRRGGFRPPSGPVPSEEVAFQGSDPLNFPPGYQTPGGGSPGLSAVNPGSGFESKPAPSPAPAPVPEPTPSPTPAPKPPPPPPKQPDFQYATKVQGKPGWIRSPYDGKLLDATGFLRGEQVADPHTGKIMLVP